MTKFKFKKFLSFALTILLMISNWSFLATASEINVEEMSLDISAVDSIISNSTETYYIVNVISKKFLRKHIEYTAVTTSLFAHSSDMCWEFEYIGNNKYCIRPMSDTDYALYGIGSDVEIDIMTSTPSPYYLWTIQPAVNGGFIIANCGGENVLHYDGEALSLVDPLSVNDADYDHMVWELIDSERYIFFTDHYYDEGFEARFESIDTNVENLIREYQDAVVERFSSIFNVQVLSTYTAYTSIADTCKIDDYGAVTAITCEAPCTHGINQSHTNMSNIVHYSPVGTQQTTTTIWTGHLLANGAGSASYVVYKSIIISPWLTRTFLPPNENEEEIAAENTFDLMHELSHQIGALDHYCYGVGLENKCRNPYCDECVYGMEHPRYCIMSYRDDISTLTDEEMYCSDCIEVINEHLESHH